MTYIQKKIPINTDEVISHFALKKIGDCSYADDYSSFFAEHKWASQQFTN